MTRHNTKSLPLMAVLSILIGTPAVAEPGPDAIMLEKIGAVHFATPDELKQRYASAPSRNKHEQQQN